VRFKADFSERNTALFKDLKLNCGRPTAAATQQA
jgi:hypothetical protein